MSDNPTEGFSPELKRAEAIHGLRLLADFLDAHPEVPTPMVSIYETAAIRERDAQRALLAWIGDGDGGPITDGVIDCYKAIARSFAGLTVTAQFRVDHVGTVEQVPTTRTEVRPYTPDELRALTADTEAVAS